MKTSRTVQRQAKDTTLKPVLQLCQRRAQLCQAKRTLRHNAASCCPLTNNPQTTANTHCPQSNGRLMMTSGHSQRWRDLQTPLGIQPTLKGCTGAKEGGKAGGEVVSLGRALLDARRAHRGLP